MKGVAVLGSTGSIGVSTLDVLARHPDRYRVVALTANTGVDKMVEQCLQFRPQYVAMADEASAEAVAQRLREHGLETEAGAGVAGLQAAAAHPEADDVMAAIVGAAGLAPTLAAVRKGKRILLANKEALVVAGALFMQEVQQHGAEVLPIDSEHNAVFQCMPGNFREGLSQVGVERILLTASGGPFRTRRLQDLESVTPEQACAHPNWDMGRKISVDSATMMNKGLEVIEARWLFDAAPDQIHVVVHPQSVIHSMVEYADGSVLAQLGNPDMRTPIAHALAWPERHSSGVASLNLFDIARLDFEAPDTQRFPCLRLAFEAVSAGGVAPAVLNAANEVAVDRFLEGAIRFTAIPKVIEQTLERITAGDEHSLDGLMAADGQARQEAEQRIAALV
jgi:1-deoxy-D-xylulose-5-phosphate reductoisomerase